MLPRTDIVGFPIHQILADTSSSDNSINFADFVLVSASGKGFRMPYDDESGDWLEAVTPTKNHHRVEFPVSKQLHYRDKLWRSDVVDVLVPEDPDLRFPDSARIQLASGWYIVACSGAPIGILPTIDITPDIATDDKMTSIWALAGPSLPAPKTDEPGDAPKSRRRPS